MKPDPSHEKKRKPWLLYSAGCLVLIISVLAGGWLFINHIIYEVYSPQFFLKTTEIKFSDNMVSFPVDYRQRYRVGLAFSNGGARTRAAALAWGTANAYRVRLHIDDSVTSFTLPSEDLHRTGGPYLTAVERNDGLYEAVWVMKISSGNLNKVEVGKFKGSRVRPEVVRVYLMH